MKRAHLVIAFSALALILAGCSESPTSTSSTIGTSLLDSQIMDGNGGGGFVYEDLSEEEAAGLIFMREEEKLARDVYLTFSDSYDLTIFVNIAGSEQMHMNQLLMLLDRYDLEDPVGDNGIGVFVNPDLQALYDELVAQGGAGLVEALEVGGAIEEIDILDLLDYIDVTDHADLARIYGRLEMGSENHLRGFVYELDLLGVTYVPGYLSQEVYDAIIDGSHGSGCPGDGGWDGGGDGGGGGHGHGGGHGGGH